MEGEEGDCAKRGGGIRPVLESGWRRHAKRVGIPLDKYNCFTIIYHTSLLTGSVNENQKDL